MTKYDRKIVLERLIRDPNAIAEIRDKLTNFKWDTDRPIVTLKMEDIISVMQKYICGSISDTKVENWANIIEGRDDIEYEIINEDDIRELIFFLANPTLTENLNIPLAQQIVARYKK